MKFLIFCMLIVLLANSAPADDLTNTIKSLRSQRQLRGLQVQVTKKQQIVYNLNLGEKNQANQPIDNNTLFRSASVSKSFSSVGLLQLVEKGKLRLNQSLSSIFGFKFQNPNFPGVDITVQMILSHQSSLVECDPYYSNFLSATSGAKSGAEVPSITQLLLQGGQFYNSCMYSKTHSPGSYFLYVNINFGIAGTIIQLLSGQRFDEYQRNHILGPLCLGLPQTATFNIETISDPKNLGVLYRGQGGKWVPSLDNYPTGVIPKRNTTGYKIGTNAGWYGPQGSIRASATHLNLYAIMIANKGVAKSGQRILSQASVQDLIRPRYQFHGSGGGSTNDFNLYGLGLYTTTYRTSDNIIDHQVVVGHTGSAYNLVSAQYLWGDYTLSYIINGALNGYKYGTGTIYQYQRLTITRAIDKFIQAEYPKQKAAYPKQKSKNIRTE